MQLYLSMQQHCYEFFILDKIFQISGYSDLKFMWKNALKKELKGSSQDC